MESSLSLDCDLISAKRVKNFWRPAGFRGSQRNGLSAVRPIEQRNCFGRPRMLQLRSLRVITVAFALILFVCLGWAQSDLGSISGFVRDPSGAVIPNAKVTVTNPSGIERSTVSNESGYYTITNLPPGTYTLRVEASGFKRYETTGNKLDPSSNLAIDAALTIGAATETVEVSATAVALQSESASVQNLITRQQIDLLELNGRNPVGLAGLVPGARGGTAASLSFGLSQGPS